MSLASADKQCVTAQFDRVGLERILTIEPAGNRPSPILCSAHEPAPHRIAMNIVDHLQNHGRVRVVVVKATARLPKTPLAAPARPDRYPLQPLGSMPPQIVHGPLRHGLLDGFENDAYVVVRL